MIGKFSISTLIILLLISGGVNAIPYSHDLYSPSVNWTQVWNSTAQEYSGGIAIDNFENIYVGGTTTLTDPNNDVIMLKYSSDGKLLWNKTWNCGKYENVWDVKCYQNDSVLIGGDYNNGSFLIRIGYDGGIIWNRSWNQSGGIAISSIMITSNGTIIEGGTSNCGMVWLWYNSSGILFQKYVYNIPGHNLGLCDMIMDKNGSMYFVGTYRVGISPGIPADIIIGKLNESGSEDWNVTWGGSQEDGNAHICMDNTGIYVAGETSSYGTAVSSIVVQKYDFNGNNKWSNIYSPSSTTNFPCGSEILSNGNILIAGTASYNNIYVLEMTPIGGSLGNYSYTDSKLYSSGITSGMVVNNSDTLYVSGGFRKSDMKTAIFIMKIIHLYIPEYATMILPLILTIALFVVILRKSKRRDR